MYIWYMWYGQVSSPHTLRITVLLNTAIIIIDIILSTESGLLWAVRQKNLHEIDENLKLE